MKDIESRKIINYKSKLENILKISQHGKIDKTINDLKELLKVELLKEKLTQEEYNELLKYMDEINLKNELEYDTKEKVIQFKESVKIKEEKSSSLDPIIMYKGKIGEVAPKKQENEKEIGE